MWHVYYFPNKQHHSCVPNLFHDLNFCEILARQLDHLRSLPSPCAPLSRRSFILEAVSNDWRTLRSAPQHFRCDVEVLVAAATQTLEALELLGRFGCWKPFASCGSSHSGSWKVSHWEWGWFVYWENWHSSDVFFSVDCLHEWSMKQHLQRTRRTLEYL